MARPLFAAVAAGLSLLLLGACSLSYYNLRPHFRAGVPAFGTGSRLCAGGFRVVTTDPVHSDAPREPQLSNSNILWAFEVPHVYPQRCIRGPIVYGVVPPGAVETHPPRQLYSGIVYTAYIESGRRGLERFRLTERGRIERLPRWEPN